MDPFILALFYIPYRESSAQTLPYLPGVANEKEELDEMELFKLPTILPGDGPPGLYEVEVLERSRKRWAFAKALKANFKAQLEEAKAKAKLPQNTQILAAFEWEHWIEREEYIQECQMMRLELVIRMFDKREKEMHDKSKTRLQMSCDLIKARKNIELENSENRLKRELRLLSKRNENAPLRWRKQNIVDELGKPNLEFYAPQMRYGFNAARRNFVGGRKAFETRMDDLEKRAVNMNNMECPFAKLKQWSKPKERIKEVEQNFCTDSNLKKLYESLKVSFHKFNS